MKCVAGLGPSLTKLWRRGVCVCVPVGVAQAKRLLSCLSPGFYFFWHGQAEGLHNLVNKQTNKEKMSFLLSFEK